jgi:hypothetical protein
MLDSRFFKPKPMMLAATAALLLAAQPAAAGRQAMSLGNNQFVRVSVNYTIQRNIEDKGEEAMVAMQEQARRMIYNMAKRECTQLLEVLAETCKIASINVSVQIRPKRTYQPRQLYITGRAQYRVKMK